MTQKTADDTRGRDGIQEGGQYVTKEIDGMVKHRGVQESWP